MRVISAYLLAVLGGKASPTAEDINAILSSVGVEADSAKISKLLAELDGKDLNEVLAAGREKLASVPAGGAVSAAAAPTAGAAPAAGAAAAAPKAEAKKEEEPESDEDMGFSLFD